jgi:hypothetical protein
MSILSLLHYLSLISTNYTIISAADPIKRI